MVGLMKAISIRQHGGPEVLEIDNIPEPAPQNGEVLINIEFAGVNYIDTYHREGLYPVGLPFVPGIEAAGTVEEVGEGVRDFRPGERVAYCLTPGSYAERAVVPDWKVVRLPDEVSYEEGAAAMCQGMTAHYLVTDCYRLRKGDIALVHAAAGGVGLLLVQLAKHFGATVIGTVSTREKAELALNAGADHVIQYIEQDFEAEVKRITGGEGVHVVYESVGKATFDKSMDCLRPRGYMVLYGQSSGPVGPLDPQVLNQKGSIFLTRPSLFSYAGNRSEFLQRAGGVLELIESGRLSVKVGEILPLSQAARAHERLQGRLTVGKVLLKP